MVLIITFLFCIIFARFFYIQAVWGSELRYRAADQWNRELPIIAPRGKIYDCNGQIISGNRATYSVFVRPNAVKDLDYTAATLAEILQLDGDLIAKKLRVSRASEVTVKRRTEKQNVEALCAKNLPGVYYAGDNTRVYPYGEALCQVLGFTASDGTGLTGLEKYYDEILTGKNGEIAYTTDIVGVETEDCKIVYKEAVSGSSLRLTVDMEIQLAAEEAMRSVYLSSGAKRVSCIVLDPNDFGVLALVNYPSYDLNDVPREDVQALNMLSRNAPVSDIYEPGSTFKILTAATDIEEYLKGNKSAYSPSQIFNGSRTRTVDGTKIKCWSDHANGKHSNQTLAEALNNSCNPCFTDMALALGKNKFYEYLKAFGLGSATGIDFAGEARGMLVSESTVRDCDLARIGFGQSVAVSGLQLACASAAAVNGGYYYVPRIVKAIVSPDGNAERIAPVLKNRPISEKASKILREMLEGVVTEGSGKKAYIEGYRVAGKTGTAQKYEDGKIARGKYVSSFVGFFPADRPQYLALIIVDEPVGTYYGSAVAAPVAREIFSDIIKIKNIQPFK